MLNDVCVVLYCCGVWREGRAGEGMEGKGREGDGIG